MKQTPDMRKVQERMMPGVLTRDGMLGADSRTIQEIIDADTASVERSGLTNQHIARRMQKITERAITRLGDTVTIDGYIEARVDETRGTLACPFGDGIHPIKRITYARNLRTNESIRYTDLSIHLIEAHGFYEGQGAPFRTDPEQLVRVMEIRPPQTDAGR